MKNLSISGAQKMSLEMKAGALQQLILQRYQALVAISSIAFAVAGVIISVRSDLIKNQTTAITAAVLFIVVALASLCRHLFLLRDDIKSIGKKIKELPHKNWEEQLEEKEFVADWWPEALYGLLVLGVILFGFSLL